MSSTTYNIIIGILSVALLLMVYMSIYRRKTGGGRRLRAKKETDDSYLIRLFADNSRDGTIQNIASQVSDILKDKIGCDKIVFLRKQHGSLVLNYYHGISRFSRGDFQIQFSEELAGKLKDRFDPSEVAELKDLLSDSFLELLHGYNLDLYFPVFWRKNLYGLFFVHTKEGIGEGLDCAQVASLVHALSAAYHMKWHEEKLDRMTRKITKDHTTEQQGGNVISNRVLRLVRHRNPDTIMKEIFDSARSDLDLKKAVYIYSSPDDPSSPRLLHSDNLDSFQAPGRNEVDDTIEKLEGDRPVRLDDSDVSGELCSRFREAGLNYVISMPLASNRKGIFAWSSEKPVAMIAPRLLSYRDSAEVLVSNADSYTRARELSFTDSLTGLANQRYFVKRLGEELDRARRYNRFLALIIIDMDNLKTINDNHGHQAGDAVIRRMGKLLRSSIRAIDIVARYGGDEFCVIMPEADTRMCEHFMERLRMKIERESFDAPTVDSKLSCTISLGGALFPQHAEDSKKLIYAADMALLNAKNSGRSCYRIFH